MSSDNKGQTNVVLTRTRFIEAIKHKTLILRSCHVVKSRRNVVQTIIWYREAKKDKTTLFWRSRDVVEQWRIIVLMIAWCREAMKNKSTLFWILCDAVNPRRTKQRCHEGQNSLLGLVVQCCKALSYNWSILSNKDNQHTPVSRKNHAHDVSSFSF